MDIPLESFAKLIYRLGNPPKTTKTKNGEASLLSPQKIFQSWLNYLPRPLPPGTGKVLFRLLFPHEGSRRRYGLKEAKLAQELESVLGLKGLTRWDSVCWDNGGEGGTGCLGREVEINLRNRGTGSCKSDLSICELDTLLDELAASSPFSQLSQLPSPIRPTSIILSVMYRQSNLSPYALSVITQMILRDLRPLLNPLPNLPIRNPTTMLRLKSNAGPEQLSLKDAMLCWDKRMWELYIGGRGDIDKCADLVDGLDSPQGRRAEVIPEPVVGVNVKIPKCRKGRSIPDALAEFTGTKYAPPAREVWAETKYDGYRLQIHVDCSKGSEPVIKVFSKSTRDSTTDRINAHSIILSALSLPVPTHLPSHPALHQRLSSSEQRGKKVDSIILEAEVVPYNESSREGSRGKGVEEFWWLGHAGVAANPIGWQYPTSGVPRNRSRHLCLVFFDVLLLNGESLLRHTYEARRSVLERVIRPIEGFAMLAARTRISMGMNRQFALGALEEAFQISNTRREEGLVLKASDSTYTNMRWQWVKLKKDYIPNLGDCVDLVLLGAGWDIDRARELRVDTSVFTTFYMGVLTNSERLKTKRELPHFEFLFRASYGLDRTQLEVYNENIRYGRWASKSYDKDDLFKRRLLGLSWTYSLPRGMAPPSVLFQSPLCAEVMGAGFQRLPGSELYEIRWPRLMKIYDPSDRQWIEALSAHELIRQAHISLGYNTVPSPRSSNDSIKIAWRTSSTLALIDVPDLASPRSPRGTKRIRSEPNIQLGPGTSLSPHWAGSSINSGQREGPGYPASQPGVRAGVEETGRRLREMMSDDEDEGLLPAWGRGSGGPLGHVKRKRTKTSPLESQYRIDASSRLLTNVKMAVEQVKEERLSTPPPPSVSYSRPANPHFGPHLPLRYEDEVNTEPHHIIDGPLSTPHPSLSIAPREPVAPSRSPYSRASAVRQARTPLSPLKKVISSIDWSLAEITLDQTRHIAFHSTPESTSENSALCGTQADTKFVCWDTKKTGQHRYRGKERRIKPLSLRSRMKILANSKSRSVAGPAHIAATGRRAFEVRG